MILWKCLCVLAKLFIYYVFSESSLQMKRSSGDGEDAPVPSSETKPVSANQRDPMVGPKQQLLQNHKQLDKYSDPGKTLSGISPIPHDVNFSSIKNLIPYEVKSGPVVHAKKNRFQKPNKSNNSALKVVSETEINVNQMKSGLPSPLPVKNMGLETSVLDIKTTKSPCMNKVKQLAERLPKEAVMQPLNYSLLNTPPPSIESKDKIRVTPKPPGVPTSKHASVKYIQLTRKTFKEPRFIPFEPFKGSTAPLFTKTRKKSIRKDVAFSSQPVLPVGPETKNMQVGTADGVTLSVEQQEKKARAKLDTVVKDFECERSQWEEKVKTVSAECDKLKQQLSNANREKVSLEDQLNIQAQVLAIAINVKIYI